MGVAVYTLVPERRIAMIVSNWTGVEVKALRLNALRRTQKDFAASTGFSLGAIRKWESRGKTITLSGEYAEGMDTMFRRLDDKQRARFHAALADSRNSASIDAEADELDDRLQFMVRKPEFVDLVTVSRLQSMISDLEQSYGSEPSTSLLARAGQYLGQTQTFQIYASTEPVRRALFAAEARSAAFMSRVIWDASQRRDNATAQLYLKQSISAAHRLGDLVTEGQSRLRQGYISLYGEKDPKRGLDLTAKVADDAQKSSTELAGIALLHKAEALAMLGRETDCEKALSQADKCFDRIVPSEYSLGLYTTTQRGRLAGSCYLSLGKPKRAQMILEGTFHENPDSSKTLAIIAGNLSLAHVRQHAMDEAASTLHQAIDLVEETRGGAGLNIVFTACREMQAFRDIPVVRNVYDRVLALMAT